MAELDIIVRLLTEGDTKKAAAELKKLAAASDQQGKSAKTAAASSKRHGDTVDKSARQFESAGRALKGFIAGYLSFRTAVELARASFDRSQRAFSTANLLNISIGNQTVAVLDRLRHTADEVGVNYLGLAEGFGKFNAAAKSSNLTLEQQLEIFESVSTAARVLNLSGEATGRVFTALEQMISGGTVRSEELSQQLKDSLPGSFQIAAKAAGVTTTELRKMLEQGKLLTEDFLPKFAREIRVAFPLTEDAARSAGAELERFTSSWDRLLVSIGNGTPFAKALRALTSITDALGDGADRIDLSLLQSKALAGPNPRVAAAEIFAQRYPLAPRLDQVTPQSHPELFQFIASGELRDFRTPILEQFKPTKEGDFFLKDFTELNRILAELNAANLAATPSATPAAPDAPAAPQLSNRELRQRLRLLQEGHLLAEETHAAALGFAALERLYVERDYHARQELISGYYQFQRQEAQGNAALIMSLHDQEYATLAQLAEQKTQALRETSVTYVALVRTAQDAIANLAAFGANAFVQLFQGGKIEARQFFASLFAQIAQAIIQIQILGALKSAFGDAGGTVGAIFSGVAAADGIIAPRRAANGIQTVSQPTYFPNFNVLAGEAGTEVLTVLSKPRKLAAGGVEIMSGMAQGTPLSILNTNDLGRMIQAAQGHSAFRPGAAAQSAPAAGAATVNIRLAPGLEADLVQTAVAQSRITIETDLQQQSGISTAVKHLVG